jgi:hypothetical protein
MKSTFLKIRKGTIGYLHIGVDYKKKEEKPG